MSAASLIKKFGQTITVKRDTNPESTVKGRRVDDIYKTFTMIASVQPMEPDDIVEDEVGSERNKMGIKIYSSQELVTINNPKRTKADIVVYQGEEYEVRKVDKYILNRRSLAHYRSLAMLMNKKVVNA